MEQLNVYRHPQKFIIASELIEFQPGEFKNIDHEGYVMDIEFQILKFLEMDGIFEAVKSYQFYISQLPDGCYKNFINGNYWKRVSTKYPDKLLLPLFIYNDDFMIDDKSGAHASTNSISAWYYIFPTLPPYLFSKLDCIFHAMTVKAADIKKYGINSPLYVLKNILYKLEVEGVTLFAGTPNEEKVYIVTVKVIGDNLGLHVSCGFRPCFTMDNSCMICEVNRADLMHEIALHQNLIRTIVKYDAYFEEGTFWEHGIEKRCILNELPSFHAIENRVADIMHDCELGSIKWGLEKAFKEFSRNYRDFNAELLNHRIKTFDCGDKQKKNVPGPIRDSQFTSGLNLNASESLFPIEYFPLILYNIIPYQDPNYRFLLDLRKVVQNCFSLEFDTDSINELNINIVNIKEKYKNLYNAHLRPKDHHMLHYGFVIEENGPLIKLSTKRLEAKHQVTKAYTNVCKSRRNICYSICKKNAYEFANFLLTKDKTLKKKVYDVIVKKKDMCEDVKYFIAYASLDWTKFLSGFYMIY